MSRDAVRAWLTRHTRLEPALLDGAGFDRLVEERMTRLELDDAGAYVALLAKRPGEVEHLMTGVAVPESWLFRYARSFELLARDLETRKRVGALEGRTLRMLSVACAKGEESCSMAITALHAGWPATRIAIDAIDVNGALIDAARRGQYGAHAARDGLLAWARPWMTQTEGVHHVAPEVLATIEYVHGDALTTKTLGGAGCYDVVFCRNVLIYLSAEGRAQLVARLAEWLEPGGLLFVGHAEPPAMCGARFSPVDAPHAFALRRVKEARPVPAAPTPAPLPPRGQLRGELRSEPRGEPRGERRSERLGNERPEPPAAARPGIRQPTSVSPVDRVPHASIATLADARALADRGRLDEALRAAERVLADEGPAVEALALLGDVQLALGRLRDARDSFRRAVYLDPGHGPSLLQLALVSERLGTAGAAAQYRRRAERAHREHETNDEAKP